jgi:hypothetical protein
VAGKAENFHRFAVVAKLILCEAASDSSTQQVLRKSQDRRDVRPTVP